MYNALPFAPSTLIAAQPGCTSCGSNAGVGSGSGSGGPGSGSAGGPGGGSGGPGGAGPGYPPGTYPLGGGLVYVPGAGVVSSDELPGLTEAPALAGGGGDTNARKRKANDLFWLLALLALATGLAIGRKKRT